MAATVHQHSGELLAFTLFHSVSEEMIPHGFDDLLSISMSQWAAPAHTLSSSQWNGYSCSSLSNCPSCSCQHPLPWKPLRAPCTSLQHQDPCVHYNKPPAFLWTHQVKSPRGLCCSCSKEHRTFPPLFWKSSSRASQTPQTPEETFPDLQVRGRFSHLLNSQGTFFSVLSLF